VTSRAPIHTHTHTHRHTHTHTHTHTQTHTHIHAYTHTNSHEPCPEPPTAAYGATSPGSDPLIIITITNIAASSDEDSSKDCETRGKCIFFTILERRV